MQEPNVKWYQLINIIRYGVVSLEVKSALLIRVDQLKQGYMSVSEYADKFYAIHFKLAFEDKSMVADQFLRGLNDNI